MTRRARALRWWDSRDAWTQIMIGAALLCAFELLAIRVIYPYLLEAVTAS